MSAYRKIVKDAGLMEACSRCGLAVPEIIEVHHKDRDRANNAPENLEALCPSCHKLEHLHDDRSGRRKTKAPPTVSYTFRMPADLKRLIDSAAKSGGVSTAQLVVDACWKYLGAAVPVRDGRDTRVPSDGAALSRVVEAVPAKNNGGFLGSDAQGTSGVDLRSDEDSGSEVVHRAEEDVRAEGRGQKLPEIPRPSVCRDDTPTPRPMLGKRSGPGEIVGCIHSVPTRGCPVCGGKFETLAAIAAGNFTRAPQVEEEGAGDAGAPTPGRVQHSIRGVVTAEYDNPSDAEATPSCVSCEAPLVEGRGKLAGKFSCADLACGMYGKEQKGKR